MTGVAAGSRSPRDRISLRLGSGGDGVGMAGTPCPPHGADGRVGAQAHVHLPDRPGLQPPSADGAGAPAPRGPEASEDPRSAESSCPFLPGLTASSSLRQGGFVSAALSGRVLRLGGIHFPEGPGEEQGLDGRDAGSVQGKAGCGSGSCSPPRHLANVCGEPRALLAWHP